MPEGLQPQSRLDLGPDSSWFDPDSEPSPEEIANAATIRARLLSEPFLDSNEVSSLLGADDPVELAMTGQLLGLKDHDDWLFPAFQFEPETNQPIEVVTKVNSVLGSVTDGWGVAGWWIEHNGRLPDDKAPKDYLSNPLVHDWLVNLAESIIKD